MLSRSHFFFSCALVFLLALLAVGVLGSASGTAMAAQPPPTPGPTPTPVGYQEPQVQGFAVQQASAPTDRGLDPADLIVNLFDSADLLNPVRTLDWEDPLAFHLECFGETFPYEGCKLVPDLADGADWSVKWEGTLIVPADGDYTFTIPGHDDGVRVFIDGVEIVDSGWRYPSPDVRPPPQTIRLTAGLHSIVVDYEQRVPFAAELEVRWQGPGFAEEVLPVAGVGKPRIEAVEFTQAIQEFQTLDELKQDLADDGEPPVPIVAQKPAVARIYFREVAASTPVLVRLTVPGFVSLERFVVLPRGCDLEAQRLKRRGCSSVDIYFGPPEGDWVATVQTFDGKGVLLESHEFHLTSRQAKPIRIVPVGVCRIPAEGGPEVPPVCLHGRLLLKRNYISLLRSSAPTHRVQVVGKVEMIEVSEAEFPDEKWWFIGVPDQLEEIWVERGMPQVFYHALVDVDAPSRGEINGISRRPVASATRVRPDDARGTRGTVAHEIGHLLGRKHTNTAEPEGVCGLQGNPDPNWPYGDNRIQEVGFDVLWELTGTPRVKDPDVTYDWMSNCAGDRWASPYTYKGILDDALSVGVDGMPRRETAVGTFWEISGSLEDGELSLEPIFTVQARGPVDSGTGSYRLEVVGSGGEILFTRFFDPEPLIVQGRLGSLPLSVFELVPVFEDALQIRVIGPDGQELDSVIFAGDPPSVTITYPVAGVVVDGSVRVQWQGEDPDSERLFYRVQFSSNGGETVSFRTARLTEQELAIDFSLLPGCQDSCLLRVLVSDGVNSAVAEVRDFTVAKKAPEIEILSPQTDAVFGLHEGISLSALALDMDDGYLDGEAVTWTSDRDGFLGNGSALYLLSLSEGTHEITVVATDADGNQASESVRIQVDGTLPYLDLFVVRDAIPSRCVDVTISASDEPGGSGLASVEYSLDGGQTWTAVPLDQLPFHFVVPGSGRIDLVARAVDGAGNLNVSDIPFTIAEPCPALNRPPSAEAGGPYTSVEGSVVTLDASGSSDPDGHALRYEWDLDGDGLYDDAVGERAQVTFGDDGSFVVGLKVTDKFGLSDTDTAEVVVTNLPPEVTLDTSPAVSFPGGEAFLGRVGVAQSHAAEAVDAGSDDLTFEWSTGQTVTYFNDGERPDAFPSPGGVFPFRAEDSVTVAFEQAGVYDLTVQVRDDDGGAAAEGMPKVVTGDAVCTRSRGFWRHQFRGKGKRQIDEDTLNAYLQIVDFASAYFQEQVSLSRFGQVEAVLDARGPSKRGKAEAQVLAAWLNFAHGAIGWDEVIVLEDDEDAESLPFQQLIAEAEAILLDPDASDEALERAKDLAEAVNERDEDLDKCEEEDSDENLW